jgi:lipoprotein-releasing system permease protein
VESWNGYRRSAIAAVENEQMMMMVVFAMIGIIAVFIVFVVFYMIVSHKSKDIGILKSIGVSKTNLISLFLNFAFLVGVFGSAVGAFGGWLFLMKINRIEDWLFRQFEFQLWDRTLYAIGDIPNAIDLKVLTGIILSAILACLIGALVPSWQAAKLQPVKTLQVDQL